MSHEYSLAALEKAANRQAAEEAAARAISQARTKLLLGKDAQSAFFATLALRLTARPDWQCETMATDGRSLIYQPGWVQSLPQDELKGVVAHEVMHNALTHPARRHHRDPMRWNIACDLAVNPLLIQAGFQLPSGRLMPGEGKYHQLAPGKSAEEYYGELQGDPLNPNGQSQEPGQGQDPGKCGSVRDPGDESEADARQMEAEWHVAVAQAQQAAKQRGELPGGLARLVEEVLTPNIDWRDVLREFVSRHARNDYAWSPPNSRFIHAGLYLPGLRSEELGDVVLAVDTSGSIGEAELNRFAGEAQGILDAYECELTILYHDTEIQGVEQWTPADGPLVLSPKGGGGTDHRPVFDWLDQQGIAPSCLICLTDMDSLFPETAPAFPVLWASTKPCSNPVFGLCVHVTP
jgi:predicted metal-dependent peptidase